MLKNVMDGEVEKRWRSHSTMMIKYLLIHKNSVMSRYKNRTQILREDIMKESVIYQDILEQGNKENNV
ncbi:hypothetical protein I8748_09575 [Nostoc sp. CENA67]|uniref:Uncharacterized protein n=1 Tax=Amazonocrinis nigriterrae CENA67 TaxID=2794033 RepID=A0A8J7L7Q1_9NOST|nr:hypothetical protein [Amazonocrinis nigriterrae]MBH8562360.1 hypothetical protein [Amazonocrinis nigriterrae CENA67]MBH8562419.1 hypothetical protein [Amazonocrinis nigriterrae CENA67]